VVHPLRHRPGDLFSVDRAEDGAVVRDGPHGRVQGQDGQGAEVLPGLVHAVAGAIGAACLWAAWSAAT